MASSITRDDIIKLANLARLQLTENEIAEYSEELSQIIDYVKQLQSVDLDDILPTNQVTGLENVWREDEVIDYGYDPKSLLNNVPQKFDGYIKVKRMIE